MTTAATATQPDVITTVADLDAGTEQKQLANALQFLSSVLPNRAVIPVLAGVLIEGRGGDVKVSAFDYEVSVTEIIAGAGTGKALVPGKLLAELVKSMDKGSRISLKVDGKNLVLTGDGVTYRVPTLPLDEYPQLPDTSKAKALCGLGADQLAGLIDVASAAGRDDTLPVLTGVCFSALVEGQGKAKSATLQVASTDRYRLTVFDTGITVPAKLDGTRLLVPAPTVVKVAKAFKGGTVKMSYTATGEGIVSFTDGVRTVTSRLLEGEFPKYRLLLPDHTETQAVVSAKELTKAVRQVALVASRTSPVRLTITEAVRVEAGGLGDAEAEKDVDAGVTGPEVTIAFNPHYLLDGIAATGRDTVAINIVGPTKPAVLTGVGRPEMQYLLMPVRLAG